MDIDTSLQIKIDELIHSLKNNNSWKAQDYSIHHNTQNFVIEFIKILKPKSYTITPGEKFPEDIIPHYILKMLNYNKGNESKIKLVEKQKENKINNNTDEKEDNYKKKDKEN